VLYLYSEINVHVCYKIITYKILFDVPTKSITSNTTAVYRVLFMFAI